MKFVVEKIRLEHGIDDTERDCYQVHIKFEDGQKEHIYWDGCCRLTKAYIIKEVRQLILNREYAERSAREHKSRIEQSKQFVGREFTLKNPRGEKGAE